LAFSPDGAKLAVGDACHGFGFCDLAGKTIWYQRGESRMAPPTADVAFSPDGSLLAVADDPDEGRGYLSAGFHVPVQGADGTIRLIDTTTKETRHEICVESSQGLHRLAFAPDGKTLYAAYEDGHLRAWDVSSGNLVASYRVQSVPWFFTPIAFSCDGRWLAVDDRDDGLVAIWDLAAARKVAAIDASTASTDALAVSRAALLLAVADPDDERGTVSFWEIVERTPDGKR
jgi:WD40 repeat protein